jgi:hypothetical protein
MAGPSDQGSIDTFRNELLERIAQRQQQRKHGANVSQRRAEFRQAAAVLTSFDPAALQPVGGAAEPTEALTELMDDAVGGCPASRGTLVAAHWVIRRHPPWSV